MSSRNIRHACGPLVMAQCHTLPANATERQENHSKLLAIRHTRQLPTSPRRASILICMCVLRYNKQRRTD